MLILLVALLLHGSIESVALVFPDAPAGASGADYDDGDGLNIVFEEGLRD